MHTILVDGRRGGTWTRQQRLVRIIVTDPADLDRVAEEALTMAGPLGGSVDLRTG